MPDKVKTPRKSKEKALADRVYRHYKALKSNYKREWIATRTCSGCSWSTFQHLHGYNKIVTPNEDWLFLAKTHGISVREVKDIVTKKRGWTPDQIMEDREHEIKVLEESAANLEAFKKEHGLT